MQQARDALVAVLIGVVSCGLFLVFVARIRDVGARMSCSNNLRLLGVSLTLYHDCYNQFPPAAVANKGLPPEKRLSWVVMVVPFVQSDNLYSKMDKKKGWDAEENRFAAVMRVVYLLCPGHSQRMPDSTFEPSDYIGLTGIGADAVTLPQDDPRAGVFGYERKLSLTELHSYEATTLVLMETACASGSWAAAGISTARGLETNSRPYVGADGQFGGIHRGGVNALFADASVKFLKESIQPDILEAFAKVNDKSKPRKIDDDLLR
jgi:prepilin-type processing-associated H-X9-DG protein